MSFPGDNHTCTIQRATLLLNGIGEEGLTWANLATSVRCLFYRPKGVENVTVGGPIPLTHRLMLPYGQDVTEKDRITSIVSEDGTTLATEAAILFVAYDPSSQQHHVECDLHEVRTF